MSSLRRLNKARNLDLISAERRREINQKWRTSENEREELMDYLKELLGEDKPE